MINRLTLIQRRALAIGLLIVLLTTAYFSFIEPIVAMYQEQNDRIAHLQKRLEGYQKIAAERNQLQQDYSDLKQQLSVTQTGYLNSTTKALAAAELQDHVKQVVANNGGNVTSTQILQNENEKDKNVVPRVSIKIQMTGSIDTVQKVFHTLETDQLKLFIDNVYLRGRSAYMAAANKQQSGQLDIRFTIYGYIKMSNA